MRPFLSSLWERIRPFLNVDYSWDLSRRFFFSVIFLSLVVSKVLHIYTHAYYVTLNNLLTWGSTFFLRDLPFLLIARALTKSFQWRSSRAAAALVALSFAVYVSLLASAMISFYAIMGRDFHWGKAIGFFGDMVDAKRLVLGIIFLVFLEIVFLIASYFVTPYVYDATGGFMKIWAETIAVFIRCCRRRREKQQPLPDPAVYEQIALNDDDDDKSDNDSVLLMDPPRDTAVPAPKQNQKRGSFLGRVTVILATVVVLLLNCVRPRDQAYSVLSRTLPLVPFIYPAHHPIFDGIEYLPGDFSWLGNRTALDVPPVFDWLPVDEPLAGFGDWYSFRLENGNERVPKDHPSVHYNPAKDPLHIPNLHNDILEPLREPLRSGDVKIKHIILLKLESNRHDIFPLQADSYFMHRIRESHGGRLPKEVEERLSHLTPNAEHLSGIDTGFGGNNQARPKPRGGITARNAYTSGTFTLKSIAGTTCGLNPLTVEMNREWLYDIYQPCLPHIFEALSRQPNVTSETDDWTAWPWHTMWMQSVSGTYDYLTYLMPALGFQDQMTKESIDEAGGEWAPDQSQVVGDRGYMDKVLKNYFRDVVFNAEKNHKRLFLSHLTGATHLPWSLPGHEQEDLIGGTGLDYINRYLNSLVYQDEWLTDILGILQEAGVVDDTLFVMVGDHGVSLPNDGGVTPHDSPHVANEHVPLVFSHPKLPPIEVDLPVQSTQILPTILDLLTETPSLNDNARSIVKDDLLPMYQGQSILRYLIPEHKRTQEWHFTTLNTGGMYLALRSAMKSYRVVVPLIPNAKWRFTDIETDPFERQAIKDFDILSLVNIVQSQHGTEAAEWLNEAVHVAQWWIEDNHRRWNYDPNAPKDP